MTDAATCAPWDRLCAEASPDARRMLFEFRRICVDNGFDIDGIAERVGDLMCPDHIGDYVRLLELQRRLGSLGAWDRLAGLVDEYTATVNALIIFSPTPPEEKP